MSPSLAKIWFYYNNEKNEYYPICMNYVWCHLVDFDAANYMDRFEDTGNFAKFNNEINEDDSFERTCVSLFDRRNNADLVRKIKERKIRKRIIILCFGRNMLKTNLLKMRNFFHN